MDEKKLDPHFISVVMMFASACWQQLGKVPSQVTGKVERDLPHAQMTIDLLIMLREKTKGNLTDDERRMLEGAIADLELNYADEAAKDKAKPADKPAEQKPTDNLAEPRAAEPQQPKA